jgi:hypothetical protein
VLRKLARLAMHEVRQRGAQHPVQKIVSCAAAMGGCVGVGGRVGSGACPGSLAAAWGACGCCCCAACAGGCWRGCLVCHVLSRVLHLGQGWGPVNPAACKRARLWPSPRRLQQLHEHGAHGGRRRGAGPQAGGAHGAAGAAHAVGEAPAPGPRCHAFPRPSQQPPREGALAWRAGQ